MSGPQLRPPPASSTIRDGRDLDWSMARKAAEQIIKHCDDAEFTAPENTEVLMVRLGGVCAAMDAIVDALRLRKGRAP